MPANNNEKAWIGGGAIAAVLIAGCAWMFVINPELSNAASLSDQTNNAQTQNDVLRVKITKLRKDNSNLPMLTEQLLVARAGLPTSSGMTDFTRQLTAEAATHQLTLSALTVGGPKAAGTGAATTGRSGLDAIPVTLTAIGGAANIQAFLQDVQYNGVRRVLLTSIQLTPTASAQVSSITTAASATIQLSVFVAPQSADAEAQLRQQLGKVESN